MNPESPLPPPNLPPPTLLPPDLPQPLQDCTTPLSLYPLANTPVPVFSRSAKPQSDQFGNPDLPLFFPVSRLKLVLMSLVTLGLYQLYWFYQNWKYVKAHNPRYDIMPFWRAFFGYFFCHEMFSTVLSSAEENGVRPTFTPMTLTVAWIALSLSQRLSDPVSLIALLAFIPLLPVQKAVNELNVITCPNHNPNSRFTALNIVGLVIGGLIFVVCLVGAFLPDAE